MALESFHRMMDLPLEIRYEIYSLATPDRVVHTRYPFPTPGIRIGRSSCSTLIPPLLHACWETRSFLRRTGYRLAFQVTPNGRQVWFNFNRDTLFIDRGTLALMNQGINPFPLEDTQEIRRIAYERTPIERCPQAVRLALQSFGELEEVFLIEWQSKVVDFQAPLPKFSESFLPDPIPWRHIYDTRNLCKLTEIQRIDEFLPLVHNKSRSEQALDNPLAVAFFLKPIPQDTDLTKHLSEPYEKWRSFDYKRTGLDLGLARCWAELGQPKEKMPKFTHVHLLTDADHQHIRQLRRIGCEILQKRFLENKRQRSRLAKSGKKSTSSHHDIDIYYKIQC
ncbi:hypothetical protein FPANT_8173 [Fusarium pseudoanthophilum]|uniref:2EXR domain-containing protein n=1 Tax=Fusarium pseudoanthophilum TaxID=48495 RepID=A0A8H5L1S1_9HYPO|nr:hypothetical protein FPANT_8173 [Fusarium pseudoanthophilum]